MKFLVVGCGSIGQRHMSNLLTLGQDVAGCDVNAEAGEHIREKYDVDFYSNLDEALSGFSPDAVLVCTPNRYHIPVAIKALEYGSHVFIEKPISVNSEDAKKLLPIRDKKRKIVLVACNLRFHPPLQYIKRVVEDGIIGRPVSVRALFGHYLPNWRPGRDYTKIYSARREEGGGVLLDGIHEIDYILWLLGKPEYVSSFNIRGSDLNIDVEDVGEILLKYTRALASIHLNYLRHYKMRSCEVIGTDGTVLWQSFGKTPERMTINLHSKDGGLISSITQEVDPNTQYVEEMKHFIRCIEDKEEPMNPIENAILSLKIVELAKLSNKEKKAIKIGDLL
jgi:predicted dehydrogenase